MLALGVSAWVDTPFNRFETASLVTSSFLEIDDHMTEHGPRSVMWSLAAKQRITDEWDTCRICEHRNGRRGTAVQGNEDSSEEDHRGGAQRAAR